MQQMSWDPYGQGSPLMLLQKELAHGICLKGSCHQQGWSSQEQGDPFSPFPEASKRV